MSKDIRKMIDKVKNFKQLVNEDINERKFLSGNDLPKIQEFLKSLGLELIPYNLDNETNIAGNPLVRDGLNGIRATYNKRRDRLSVWFTNNFENPNNEIRKQVESFIETLM
jgi:hypothetical protein